MRIALEIEKALALNEKDEVELEDVLSKAHRMVCEYHLGSDRVEDLVSAQSEPIKQHHSLPQVKIWKAVGKLFFSQGYKRRAGEGGIRLVGTPSDIAVVKYIAPYIIGGMHAEVYETSRGMTHGQRHGLRMAFASRVCALINEQMKSAENFIGSDGVALNAAWLYRQRREAIKEYERASQRGDLKLRIIRAVVEKAMAGVELDRAA